MSMGAKVPSSHPLFVWLTFIHNCTFCANGSRTTQTDPSPAVARSGLSDALTHCFVSMTNFCWTD